MADSIRMKLTAILLIGLFAKAEVVSQVTEEWVARYGGPGTSIDVARSIAVDGSGNVYVTGNIGSGIDYDYATIKYDPSGLQEWVRIYNGPGDIYGYDYVGEVAVDASGYVYVTGGSWGSGTNFDCTTIKYSSAGNEEWVQRYNGPQGNGNDIGSSIAVDASGNVYVAGGTAYVYDDCLTIKYNSSGVEEWVQRYNGPLNLDEGVSSMAIDSVGNVYIAGSTVGASGGYDYVAVKYNSSGVEQWVQSYAGTGNADDVALSIAVDGSGNTFVTGYSSEGGTGFDYVTIKYGPSGDQQWIRKFNGAANGGDLAYSITLDASSNVFVTGSSYGGATGADFATVKYNSSGVQQWVARYRGSVSGFNGGSSIKTDDAGNVYVAGESAGSGSLPDYAVIKYNSSGVEQWVQRYGGPGNADDRARSMALDGSGNVYVTGESQGSGTGSDYATIKYSQPAGIPCDEISQVQSRCGSGGTVKARVLLSTTSHTGETVEFTIDNDVYTATVMTRGNSSRAQISVSGYGPGNHTVTLTNPAECFDPIVVNCSGSSDGPDDGWMDDETSPVTTLLNNYPNPFNPSTTFRYVLAGPGQVSLKVYNMLGQLVRVIVDEQQDGGYHEGLWDGTNESGTTVAGGIYVYRMVTGTHVETKRMLLIK